MVSVLLSTYNGEKYIAEQLDSLLSQDYPQFEVYIRDDVSTDGTVAIIDRYVKQYPGMFHKVENDGRNLGAIKSFLSLMRSVDSDYYMFCDQDDIWFNNKISESINTLVELEKHTGGDQPCCIFTNAKVSDAGGKNIIDDDLWHYVHSYPPPSIKDIYHNVVYTNPAYGCTIAFNKIARNKALEVLQDKKPIMYHDEIICRICVAYGKVTFIDTPLMIYRRTGSNVTDAHNNARSKADLNGSILSKITTGLRALSLRIKVLHLLGVRHINYLKLISTFRERYFNK